MPMRKPFLIPCIALFLAACQASIDNGQSETRAPTALQNRVTVHGYCKNFAQKYAQNHGLSFIENSVETDKKLDFMRYLSNIFQPADSVFTAGYDCHFQTENDRGDVQGATVSLFLTKTLSFAEHTKWPKLQIIPIEYVVDETSGRAGYGVFKYLRRP